MAGGRKRTNVRQIARTIAGTGVALLILLGLAACSSSAKQTGVSNVWRKNPVCFTVGQTTESEVMCALGPPSQVVPLNNRTVFYYLLESVDKDAMSLIVYNNSVQKTSYDRAVFFFDQSGILSDGVYSKERFPYIDMSPKKK